MLGTANSLSADKQEEKIELARRAVALAPNLSEAHKGLAYAFGPGEQFYKELHRAGDLNPGELDLIPQLTHMMPDGRSFGGVPIRPDEDTDTPDPETRRLLTMEPDLASAHVALAYRLWALGKYEKALAQLKEAVRLEPDNSGIHSTLANFYENHEDSESRIAELREAVRAQPFGNSVAESLAYALESLGRLPEAVKEFRRLLELDPKNWFASDRLVDIYVSQKDLTSAIAELRRSLKVTSQGFDEASDGGQRSQVMDHLADLLEDSGDLDGAAQIFLEQLRLHPDYPTVHNNYGNVLYDQGHIEEAIQEYREALRLQPDMSSAHHNLANCLERQKNLDGAIAEYRTALDLNPEERNTRGFLGIALAKKGDLDAAIAEFNLMIGEKPEDAWGHANLGHALLLKHDIGSAIPELKRALEIDPDIRATQNDLAWLYATAPDSLYRDSRAALLHARRAVALLQQLPVPSNEETAAILDTLAEALLLNSQAKEALATEEHAVSLAENNPELKARLERFRAAASLPTPNKHWLFSRPSLTNCPVGQPFAFRLRFLLRVSSSCGFAKVAQLTFLFLSFALTRTLPQSVPTMHSELYPFTFFALQNLSSKRWQLAKF